MTCKRCHSRDIERSRRKGFLDNARSLAGWWPWRCDACARRFYLRSRSRQRKTDEPQKSTTAHVPSGEESGSGPAMAFRTATVRPQAKIVLEADTHEQLNQILLALDRAVGTYQHQSKGANDRSYSGSRR